MPDLDALSGLFHPAQELVEIVWRQGRTPCKDYSGGIDEADGNEILFGVECAIRIERHGRRQSDLMQQDGVAVGLARAALAAAIVPPAPPTFSITTGWPSVSCMGSWMMRAIASSAPPGGNATSMVTGRSG